MTTQETFVLKNPDNGAWLGRHRSGDKGQQVQAWRGDPTGSRPPEIRGRLS
ncbi:MAG: hypothetical protein ACFB4J_08080 [Elainellaceae cyanobacterium]